MINEEKAREIVSDYHINISDSPIGASSVRYGAEKNGRMERPAVHGYLEEKKRSLVFRSDWLGFNSEVCSKLISKIINELFG